MSLIERPSSVFDELYRPFSSLFANGMPARLLDSEQWLPAVDIRREDNKYLIEMEVPGFSAEDIDVEAHDQVLTIQGKRESTEEVKEEQYVRRERRRGQFVRRFNLPAEVSDEAITATVKDGVLHVEIPEGEAPSPKKIAVN